MHSNGHLISRTFSILRQFHTSFDNGNARIRALFQQGFYQEALESYAKESTFPNNTSRFIFPSLLKACASVSNFYYGETLQSTVVKVGLLFDPYIVTSLIRMYVRRGSLSSAVKLFDNVSQWDALCQDVALWNSIIDGHAKNGFFEEGLIQFRRIQAMNVKPDGYTLCILLGMCNGLMNLSFGKQIHGYVVRNTFEYDPFVSTATIDMYSNSSRPLDAWKVFDKSENKHSIAVWNSMINSFCENGLWRNGLELYPLAKGEGLELGSTTLSSALTACSQGGDTNSGRQLHCDVIKIGLETDPYVSTSLLTFYSKCGFIEDSERVFYSNRGQEVGLWNSMLSAYVNCGCANDALDIYIQMRAKQVSPDSFTISNALIACSMTELSFLGTMIHGELIKKPIKDSIAVQSALLTMYSKLGSLNDSTKVFSQIHQKDVVAWGSMISGSCENRKFKEALDLFKAMLFNGVKPDSNVVASAVRACAGHDDEKLGSCVHGLAMKEGLDLDAYSGTALIEFYAKFGELDMAKEAFLNVLQKNLVVWNTLILCYSQNGLPDVSVSILPQILQDGLYPDSVSITIVLAAISQTAALLKGKTIHGYFLRFQLPKETQVENAFLDMYIKCGCFTYARKIFDKMSKRDLVAWNSMIAGFGSHGECHKAMDLFEEMRNSGTTPDEITFLSLISSCNHCGFISEGLNLFQLMKEHIIEPKLEHYINIVDLLGRGGRLYDAFEFIENMNIAPDRGIWLSLLSACRVHHNVELGELAANNLIQIDPNRGSNYVQLLNLYVEAGLKEKAANLRALMRQKGLVKVPGCSWIEVKNKFDVFFSGDSSSPSTVKIYETLDSLRDIMKIRECNLESPFHEMH